MLSVGNRDGRKGLGFGRDMDDTELEEGEACSYQGDDPTVDPDTALAYIGEKLQSVLGHFQKDFEGGVSAENLGAKFGGYGSFLPTYQRSPICSDSRTLKVQNQAPKSPTNLQLEGGYHNIKTAASASLPMHGADISNTEALSSTKRLTNCGPLKLDAGMERSHVEERTSRAETSKKSTLPDQKKIKVRIRVGSDNLSTQTKAELYSGLGLVASPSSSFKDSPESEGWSRETQNAHNESPNCILQIMTSAPLDGRMLLSPLAEDLANLTESIKSQKWRPDSLSKGETRKLLNLENGPGSSRNNRKITKIKNSSRINGMSLEMNNGGPKYTCDIVGNLSKETDDEASACEKMISKALKLPLLSTSHCPATDLPKSNGMSSEVFRCANKGAASGLVVNHDDACANEKPAAEVGSIRNLITDHTENLVGGTEAQTKKYLNHKGGKNYESPFNEYHSPEVARTVKQETINNQISKTDMKVGYEEPNIRSAAKDHNSSKTKSKLKATSGHNIVDEVVKGARDKSSSQSKSINQSSKYGSGNSKLHNDVRNSRDAYKDIFGDIKTEHEEKEVESSEYPSKRVPKHSQVTEVGNTTTEETSSRRTEKSITFDSHPKTGSHAATLVNDPVPDEPAPVAPVIIEEHWVCCDKCQKWRLLPVGRLPESLPEKWLCSMLDWLPGMNRCDIDEEETTKALVSFNRASVPESDKNLLGHIGGSGRTYEKFPFGIQHPSATYNSVSSDAKNRSRLTGMSIAVRSQGHTDLGDGTKKLQAAVKSRSLNDVNQSPSVTNLDNPNLKEPSDSVVEKNKKLSKGKQKLHDDVGGGMKNVKKNKKRRAGQDSPIVSKKHKNEGPTNDGWLSETDYQLPSRNGAPNGSISPCIDVGQVHVKLAEVIPYTNHIGEEIDYSKTSSKKYKDRVRHSVDGSFGRGNTDSKDSSANKRKDRGIQESRLSESVPTAGLKAEEQKGYLKESSRREHGKEKKARLSTHLSGSIRERSTERGNQVIPKDIDMEQGPDSSSFKRNMEDMDSSRRYSAPTRPFMEATSSSSKISSSRKSRAKTQDTRGSPVESVSSSPLRSRSKDLHESNGRHALDKECPPNGFGVSGVPKKYSAHEFDGTGGAVSLVKKSNGRMEKASGLSHKVTKVSVGKSKGNSTSYDDPPDKHAVKDSPSTFNKNLCEEKVLDFGRHEKAYNNTHSLLNGSHPDKVSNKHSKDSMQKSKAGTEKSDDVQYAKNENNSSVSTCRQNLGQEHAGNSNTLQLEKMGIPETVLMGKLVQSPLIGGISKEYCNTRHTPASQNGNELENTSVDASGRDDASKVLKPFKKTSTQNGGQPTTSRQPTPIGHDGKDLNASSPARRDSSSQSAANAVKEAKSLKHVADRVKRSGSNAESIGLYFQAALKFLLGASLLESSTSETRHGDLIQSTQMYSSTAKLCEFCAREFEKAQDMASAALAYKCTEVAYMRVIYSSHSNVNRDRHELQTALQMAPPGESPSSSASDVDNLNNATTGDKVIAKDASSPQVAGSHVISARNRPGFARLLNFAQDVNFAMEASRKSRATLAAANAHLEQVHNEDGIILIKKALDFNFQDVEGLLQLVRLGMEAISR